jgi:hypothetical protein
MTTIAIEHEDAEMVSVLEKLLELDENITARAVARLHSKISYASTITRSQFRSELLAIYQEKQKDIRTHVSRIKKRSLGNTAVELAKKDQKIAELEKQVEILTVSHIAMIRVVGELGGMSKWLKFFESYKNVRDELQKLSAMPDFEKVVPFSD